MKDEPNPEQQSNQGEPKSSKPITPVPLPPINPALHREESASKNSYPDRKHEPAKRTDQIMAGATVVMALATIAIGILAFLQWLDSGKLTDAASKAAIAADKFKDSAAHLEGIIGTAQENLQIMAASSSDSVKATQNALRLEQRAWLSVQLVPLKWSENQSLQYQLILINTGRTPALHIHAHAFVEKVPIGGKPHFGHIGQVISTGVLVPNSPITNYGFQSVTSDLPIEKHQVLRMSAADIDDLNHNRALSVGHAEFSYDDIFGAHHWIRACAYDAGDRTANVIQDVAKLCVAYNEIDRKQ